MTTIEQLEKYHLDLCQSARTLVRERGNEYASDDDTLETFKRAALMYGCEPKDVARMQICLKVARMKKGYKQDTVKDLINYAVYYDILSEGKRGY